MNLYLIGALASLGLAIGAFFYGVTVGKDSERSDMAEMRTIVELAKEESYRGAIDAINKQRPIHKTIQTNAKEIIREREVYRNCPSDPAVVGLLDAARSNQAPTSDSTGLSVGSGKGESQ